MKNIIVLVALSALFFSGCVTDTGFYVESEALPITGDTEQDVASAEQLAIASSGAMPSARTFGVVRTFSLPEIREVISPKGRSTLIGRWRCNVYYDSKLSCWGGYTLSHVHFCEEYDFREDGSYSKWRVSEQTGMAMLETEEKGHWEYCDGGGFCIKREYGILNMVIASPTLLNTNHCLECRELRGEPPFKCNLLWHSDIEFSVKYIQARASEVDKYINTGVNEVDLVVGPFGWNGVYDSEGCFRSGEASVTGEMVMMPQIFKKVVK